MNFTKKSVTEKNVEHVPSNITGGNIRMKTGSLHCRGSNISSTGTLDIDAGNAKFEGAKNEHTKETHTTVNHPFSTHSTTSVPCQPNDTGSPMANMGAELIGSFVRAGLAATGPVGAQVGVVAGNALTEMIKEAAKSPVSR